MLLALLAAAAAAAATGNLADNFLGLAEDRYGLVHTPSPALDSLHQDYHFLRHHSMAPGERLDLDGATSFGASAHVRVRPSLKLVEGEGSLALSLCGGATAFVMSLAMPPPRFCGSQSIHNNSNTAGWTHQTVKTAANDSEASPEWCRALCCANPICSGWTYTDPQPNSGGNPQFDCWMQEGATTVVPGGPMCSGTPRASNSTGHCWAGLGNSAGSGHWSARLNGNPVNASGRPIVALSAADGLTPGFSEVPAVDVLLDGSFVQLYFNGELVTLSTNNCSNHSASVSVHGADAVLQLDTWKMKLP